MPQYNIRDQKKLLPRSPRAFQSQRAKMARFHHQSGSKANCSHCRVGAGAVESGEGMLASPLVELAFNPPFVLEPEGVMALYDAVMLDE